MAYLYALMIAVVLTAALIGIPNIICGALQRRRFATFALLNCPKCDMPFGRSAIDSGKDTSPWEELWSDGVNHTIHCHPICRLITCSNCSANSEIRFQTQGDFFGPELSVTWRPPGDFGRSSIEQRPQERTLMIAEYVACKHCGRPILPRTWERNGGACEICVTGDENLRSAPTETLPENRDPLDVDPAYKEIMESISQLAIDAAIRETNDRFPYLNVTRDDLHMGLCHRIWHHKKRLLKELHGLEWSSPAELNPHILYD